MKVFYEKLPKGFWSVGGPIYFARAVDVNGKWEVVRWVQSFESLPKFIKVAEKALKEQCTEVVFHGGSWTKTREEIMK
jgi:hypothetical protein